MSEKKFAQFNKICTQEKGMLFQNKGVICVVGGEKEIIE